MAFPSVRWAAWRQPRCLGDADGAISDADGATSDGELCPGEAGGMPLPAPRAAVAAVAAAAAKVFCRAEEMGAGARGFFGYRGSAAEEETGAPSRGADVEGPPASSSSTEPGSDRDSSSASESDREDSDCDSSNAGSESGDCADFAESPRDLDVVDVPGASAAASASPAPAAGALPSAARNSATATAVGGALGAAAAAPTSASQQSPSSSQTLLIFDWDDTLLPSSWLKEQGLRSEESVSNESQRALLDTLAEEVAKTLRLAARCGEVVVITNAESGWIEQSCCRFMPKLWPLLRDQRLVSARSTYEQQGYAAPLDWKVLAFEAEVRRHRELSGGRRLRSLVSIGDSSIEREALLTVTRALPDCRTKALKLVERPDPDQLVRELRLICGCLRRVARHDGDLDLSVSSS
eukprot:TRINITY_DN11038_c1_g1_i2.p1 TRINITY_DN11038_c1_g1~~TRINITY_DN11038_c1_g1_i2.p1  ORF type:complete len:435 (+),score=110.32 TRINITY_DN11038_c1_g1_i2:82-1305(+)